MLAGVPGRLSFRCNKVRARDGKSRTASLPRLETLEAFHLIIVAVSGDSTP